MGIREWFGLSKSVGVPVATPTNDGLTGRRSTQGSDLMESVIDLEKVDPGDTSVSSQLPSNTNPEQGGQLVDENLYVKHVWTYVAINQIATRLAALPYKVLRSVGPPKVGAPEDVVMDSWVNDLLECPNDTDTFYNVVEGTMSYLELSGNSFWELAGHDEEQPPLKVFVLRSDRMEVVPDKRRRVKAYRYEPSEGESIDLKPRDILQFKYFHPLSEQTGMGPTAPASISLTMDFLALTSQQDFFRNGASPEGVLQTKEALGDKAFNRVKRQWADKHVGAGRSRGTPILEKGLEYQAIQKTPVEAGMIDTRKQTREDVLAAFGVPPVIVGILDHASYANAYQQEAEFWKGTLLPKLKKFLDSFNRMVHRWDRDLWLVADLSEIRQFLVDREHLLKEREQDLREMAAGAMTINEFRAKHDRDDVPWGGVWHRPANLMPVGEAPDLGEPGG